ncbi:MAG: hypothetical protein PVH59_05025 [Anaerolineae bacterium]|jgi:hypothetical protein
MNSRRKTTTVAAAMVALVVAAVLLGGCSLDRWVEVEPGAYTVVLGGAASAMPVAREIQGLAIDRDEGVMVLTLVDGSEIAASLASRDRSEWPAGCPANIQSTRMEVLEIAPDPLAIGGTSLSQPILVRDCPPEPARIVLREDGAIGGAGTACLYPEPCMVFAPASTDPR